MPKIKSIFIDLQNKEAKNDANSIIKNLHDFVDDSGKHTNYLIQEDYRHKNNQRWFLSKSIIQRGMSLLMMHELLIEILISDYKENYGITLIIHKIDSLFRKLISYNLKTIEPYLYLIDMNECEKELMEFS